MKLKDSSLFKQSCLIDGAWMTAEDGQTVSVNNPATGESIGTVPCMGQAMGVPERESAQR
jgi:succinate-semialdehyde dehydrogenase/glutarate-semialdehyde dehydrogenase